METVMTQNLFYRDFLQNKISKKSSIKYAYDVSMGADIEFLWFYMRPGNEFKFLEAHDIFQKQGMFGTDGRSIIGEFRISPAMDPKVLVDLFVKSFELCKYYVYLGSRQGAQPVGMLYYDKIIKQVNLNESIGVHIHFGNNDFIYNIGPNNIPVLVWALDCMAFPLSKIFESTMGHYVRTGTGFYGDFSDFRVKPYGIEYRSFPAFFDSKEITEGMLCLCKAISLECLSNGRLTPEILSSLNLRRDLMFDRKYLQHYIRKVYFLVKNLLPAYQDYKEEIDLVFSLARDCPEIYSSLPIGIFDSWGIDENNISSLEKEILRKGLRLAPAKKIFTTYKSENVPMDLTQMISFL
jgi:hypothetical protein